MVNTDRILPRLHFVSLITTANHLILIGLILLSLNATLYGQIPSFTRIIASPIYTDGFESNGAGWGDFDNDGDLDLFVANIFLRLGNDLLYSGNILYKNDGKGDFSRDRLEASIFRVDISSNSASWGDYDNDGDLDLFLANGFEDTREAFDLFNFLYRNNGDGSFTLINSGVLYTDKGNSTGCSWGDYDNDGDLDLVVTNRRNQNNFLYRNDGNGNFTKIRSGPIVTDGGNSQSAIWGDYDNDGDLDLFVANGNDQNNFLYRNEGQGNFTKITSGPIVTDGGDSQSGSWGDYDNDGDLDLFVANGSDQNNFLYRNEGNGNFTKISSGAMVTDGGDSQSASWGDFDNDGDLDLFVANGKWQNNFLYQNNGNGFFTKITAGGIVSDGGASQGACSADYDNDGDLDILVANVRDPRFDLGNDFLYMNNGNNNHWINLKCIGTRSNASAIGAKVRVKAMIDTTSVWQMNEISGQTGSGGQNSLNAEFGLGNAMIVDSIKIEWPSGLKQILTHVPTNRFFTIEETDIPPAPPQNLQAMAEVGKITLTWNANTEFDFLRYHIYGDTIPNPKTRIASLDSAFNTEITTTNVVAGKTYYFRITAVDNAFHESNYSMQVSVTAPKTFVRITSGEIVDDIAYFAGSAWGDYDNDDDLDLFVATNNLPGGENTTNFLYENQGNGTFERITADVITNDLNLSLAGSWGDYDNDGDLDLFVTHGNLAGQPRPNALYRNEGTGHFTKIDTGAIVTDKGVSTASSWADYDNDGDLDLFVANGGNPLLGNFLYRNEGNGYFKKILDGPIARDIGQSYGCSWGDFDNDGDLDLFVPNWNNQDNFLYKNNGDGTFTKIEDSPVVKDRGNSLGSNWVDYDNDSDLDLYVTNGHFPFLSQILSHNFFYENDGKGNFTKITTAIVADSGFFAGSGWADYDNDGDLDLFVTDNANRNNLLYQNNGDRTFTKITSEQVANDGGSSIGCSWADHDNDGDVDLFVTNATGALYTEKTKNFLYENLTTKENSWINIKCVGIKSNKSAIGAKVRVNATIDGKTFWQMQEISGQTGAAGQNSLNVEFGLGDATIIDTLKIEWPSHIVRVRTKVPLNQFLTIHEGIPPEIINHTPPLAPQLAGQDIAIKANISDKDDDLSEVTLYYRKGGEAIFTSKSMSKTGNTSYEATIPGNDVTSRGVTYYIYAKDALDLDDRRPKPATKFFPVQVKVNDPGVTKETAQSAGNEQTAYRLISLPFDVDNKSPRDVLEDDLDAYNIKKWRLFALKRDQKYAEFPDPLTNMAPGKAFWLIVKNAGKIIDTGAGISIQTDTVFSTPLHPQWNFVANPYNFSIPLSNVKLKIGNALKPGDSLKIRTFLGHWNNPANEKITELKPFEGYAVFNDTSSTSTLFIDPNLSNPLSFLSKVATKTEDGQSVWSIRILAQCQEAVDEDNSAAIVPGASNTWDEFDQPEPPVIGEYVSVYFPHPEWGRLAKIYCTDFRPEAAEGHVWPFEVKTNISDKVNLTFEGLDKVPPELEVWLVDEALKITQNLRETNHYAVAGSEHPKQLKLVVGKRDFVGEKLAEAQAIPTTYELSQNFPNPFNPATTIRYGLPKAERVTLKIYNLLGAEVATLVNDEPKAAGYHVAIWDGRNKDGEVVASGVYIYRIRAGSFSVTKKMALVK